MHESPGRPPSVLQRLWRFRIVRFTLLALFACAFVALSLTPPPPWLLSPTADSDAGYAVVGQAGLDLRQPDGALLSILPADAPDAGTSSARFDSLPREAFLSKQAGADMARALAAFPQTLELKSNVYLVAVKSSIPRDLFFSAPIPSDAQPATTLDLYAWDGARWDFVPAGPGDHDTREATLHRVPQALVLAQTKVTPPVVSAEMEAPLAVPPLAVFAEVNPQGITVKADGSLQGTFASAPATANYQVVPILSDVDDGVIRYDIVSNILVNAQTRRAHIQAIRALVAQNNLPGVQLDYQGLLPDMRATFSRFVQELSGELHARGKTLSVRVPLPSQVSDDDFESGAYDWQALGAVADALQVPAPVSANAYKPGGAMDQLLQWAVVGVNRYKLVLALDTRVQDRVNNQTTERAYDEALKALLGKIQVEGITSGGARPQQEVSFSLALLPGFKGFTRDADTQAFVYGYLDPSANLHTVYLENAESLAFKMALAGRYHLRGVSFSGLLSRGADASLWDAIARFQQSVPASAPKYQLVWTVSDSNGQQVQASAPQDLLAPLSFLWKAAPTPDRYTIGVVISSSLSSLAGDTVTIQVVNSTSSTPALVTSAPLAPRQPATTPGPTRTPTVTRTPATPHTPTPTRTPAAPRPTNPPAPAPSNGGTFGYGIQVDPNDNLAFVVGKIKQMGFGWVKLQMPWKDVQPAPGVYNWWDGRIDTFANNGIKVMLSIVKAPRWARPASSDFSLEGPPSDEHIGDFANFLGQVASRYQGKVGAIEVWNEENIRNEWGGEPFDAARYVRILCAGFVQIKASNRSMIVISGALTPTGAPPPLAVNDQLYLRSMYAAGVKDCADAIGAHPSGYANAPDFYYTGGDPDPTRGYDDHASFFFRNTMEDYHRIMVANGDGAKKLWPTEFGWGVFRYTGDQRFVYMQTNSLQKQADWTVKAYQMGKAWGWTGVMFLWNLDYALTCDCENANFGILTHQGDAPAFSALANMAK